jgi:hypothetical protein
LPTTLRGGVESLGHLLHGELAFIKISAPFPKSADTIFSEILTKKMQP